MGSKLVFKITLWNKEVIESKVVLTNTIFMFFFSPRNVNINVKRFICTFT